MRAVIDDDLTAFGTAVLPWLAREPVVHNILGTVIGSRHSGDVPAQPDCLWARVLDDAGHLAGVAVRTPPHALLVSTLSAPAADALAELLQGTELPGVQGPAPSVRAFVAAWRARTGVPASPHMAQRLYRLDAVTPVVGVPGRLRTARPDDHALTVAWTAGFAQHTGTPVHDLADEVRRWTAAGHLHVWEVDGVPVSMVGHRSPVAGVVRVGLVYTPPELRWRGYAGAAVATLSQRLLDEGALACMLVTDLANPTSNALYQRIGYRPVADAEWWTFAPGRA